MRVCMLAYSFYEDDNRVMRYAEALAGRGDEVEAIGLRKPGQPRQSVLQRVRLLSIQERVKNESHQLTYFLRVMAFFFRAMFVLSVRHLLRPYQVIHVHSIPEFLVFAAWLPRITGAKIILDMHDLTPELYAAKFSGTSGSLAFKLLASVERASASFSHHVIAPNHLWQQELIERSVRSSKCSVFLNLPDSSIFYPGERSSCESGKCVLLYPGSLQWHQGVDIAIRAFSKVVQRGLDAEFQVYGEGQAKPSLVELVRELGLEGRVFFHDALPLRAIAEIMRRGDLGVVPKRGNSFGNEAFSTKILEFMASRVPVIAADTKIDLYYFNDNVLTFFEGGSVASLAERMEQLITDRDKRARQAAEAERLVKQAFNWEATAPTYLVLVDALAFAGAEKQIRSARKDEKYRESPGND